MTSHLSIHLRQFVFERANSRCEYCLFPQAFSVHRHEPDHIMPLQHGGTTDENNLDWLVCAVTVIKDQTWVPLIRLLVC